ncbi:MAG: ATP-dependent helicase [Lachnospirales bacterium]
MDLLEGLNEKQKEGVLAMDGPVLLLAGAGSGKTRVLTHRIAYMIENGVSPYNILAITFTNKAAKEMKERVGRVTSEGGNVWVATFHSTCVRILRREIDLIGFNTNFTIYDTDDSKRLLKECLKELNIDEKQFPVNTVLSAIGSAKDELLSPKQYQKNVGNDYMGEVCGRVYELYQQKLGNNNALDFNDLIYYTIEVFTTNPQVLEGYQDRFKYIMVDEYQDTNYAQYQLVRLLSAKYKNLCVVGDDDQSIYGWRGANIDNILNFEKDFQDTVVIKLEQNYRSTQIILNSANMVIKNNIGRKRKTLWTSQDQGEKIKFMQANTDYEEGMFIGETIKRSVNEGKAYSDFAILYRTNSQSRQIEDQLVKLGMPYKLLGGTRFYERKEIKDVLAYLRLLHNNFDEIALKRIINIPKRGIGAATLGRLVEYSLALNISLYDALKDIEYIDLGSKKKTVADFANTIFYLRKYADSHTIDELIIELLEKINYKDYCNLEGIFEGQKRMENINEFVTKASEFSLISEDNSLGAFLEDIALVADIDNYEESDDAVVLMTLHSSKGLEFDTVFIAGFEDGLFPSYRSIDSGEDKELEEERRLCYVGITRAEKNLYITCCQSRMQFNNIRRYPISRFFKEIPAEMIEDLSASKISRISIEPIVQTKDDYKSNVNRLKEYMKKNHTAKKIDFEIGDKIRQMKYGVGTVVDINDGGADFEVTIDFEKYGRKKLMAKLSKLKKM